MSVTQTFDLNLIPEQAPVVVHCDQYDKGTGRLIIKLYDGDVAYTPTGTAKIQGRKPDGHGFVYSTTLSGNTVTADLTEQMSAVSGHVRCQVVVTESTGRTGSFAFILDVQPSALPDDTDLSDSDFQYLEEVIDRAEQAADDAEIAETNAEGHAEDAEAWAVGERGGVPVDPTDPTYHNNAEYYAQQASQIGSLDDLNDVTITTPTNDQVLTYDSNAGKWVNANAQSGVSDLDDLNDVTITTPVDQQVLTYDSNSGEWINANAQGGVTQLDQLSDVTISAPTDGQSLVYDSNAGEWVNGSGGSPTLGGLSDVDITTPTNGQALIYDSNSGDWINGSAGGGDFMGLYGMTEIQSSDGQGTTALDLDTYTTIGNYYCNGKGKITLNAIKYINGQRNTTISRTIQDAVFLLYVRKLPNNDIVQDIYLQDGDVSGYIVASRKSYLYNGNTTWGYWGTQHTYLQSSFGNDVYLNLNGLQNVQISSAADGDALVYDLAATKWENKPINKVTNFAVSLTGWTADTTSQSGTTLYKKQISLTNVYVDCPTIDIGCASGSTLPTVAEQNSYNLLQYCTVDDSVPCLYLYASAIPTTAFYINVEGVD